MEKQILRTLRFSDKLGSFLIANSYLSDSVFGHITQELQGCKHLEHISLTNVKKDIPVKLGTAIATMTSLKYVHIGAVNMTEAPRASLLNGLSQCRNLVHLQLTDTDTDSLGTLLDGANHPGFQSLEGLDLRSTKLSGRDLLSWLILWIIGSYLA